MGGVRWGKGVLCFECRSVVGCIQVCSVTLWNSLASWWTFKPPENQEAFGIHFAGLDVPNCPTCAQQELGRNKPISRVFYRCPHTCLIVSSPTELVSAALFPAPRRPILGAWRDVGVPLLRWVGLAPSALGTTSPQMESRVENVKKRKPTCPWAGSHLTFSSC